MEKLTCPNCGSSGWDAHEMQDDLCPSCYDEDDAYDNDYRYYATGGALGPTGHGDICHSDADPGL